MWKLAQLSSVVVVSHVLRAHASDPRTGGSRGAGPVAVPGPGARAAGSTHFPEGVLVKGDLNAEEDVIIDGVVTGTVDMPGFALTIGPGARVDARIFARDVTVEGSFSGKMTATEIVEVREGARITGELAAPAVVLADGALMNGRIETKRVDAAVHVARYRMARNQR